MTRRPPLSPDESPVDPPSIWSTLAGAFRSAPHASTEPADRPRPSDEPAPPTRRDRAERRHRSKQGDDADRGDRPEPAGDEERPAPQIDPRIEARRLAVARDEFRRRRNRLLVPIGLVLTAASAWAVSRSPLLDADRVLVAGTERTTPDQVLAAARLAPGDQLVDLDAVAVRRRIEATLPWIASARVSRSWPGTLRITVVERHPVAQVQAVDGRWFVIDVGGRLLDTAASPDPALVTIDGMVPEGQPGAMLVDRAVRAVAVLDGLSPGLQTRIGLLRFVGTDEIEFGLRPAGRVALGRPEQVAQKLQDLDTVLARVDGTCLSAIDLRVPAKPLVQRDADCLAEVES